MSAAPIHAVIGVCHSGDRTLYFKRSAQMENYPGVWNLLSIQFAPAELPDFMDLENAQTLFRRMSAERLRKAPLLVKRFLTSGVCSDNPMQRRVHLFLYELELLAGAGNLNPRFYTDHGWFSPEEYQQRAAGAACGLCLRLWSDYAFRNGLSPVRFAPEPVLETSAP